MIFILNNLPIRIGIQYNKLIRIIMIVNESYFNTKI